MESITLNQIRTDGGTQARAALNEDVVEEYLQAMIELAPFPPMVIFYDGQDYWLADGFHRLEALKRWGVYRPGPHHLDIRQGTQRDAVLFACGANAAHGLKRSNEDKRRAVQRLLQDEEWSKWADREIARRCNVSAPFVGQMRNELGVVVEERTYTTKHGTTATMTVATAEKNAHPPQLKPGEILVPIDPGKPLDDGNYVIVSPPAEYVEFNLRGGYLSKCPNCKRDTGFSSTPLPGNSVGSNKNEWDITCVHCHTKMREVKVPRQSYYFYLPNSGRKPEVEIGGQYKTEPPDGYVACDDIGLYSLCPTCRCKNKMEPNRPPRFSGYEFCQESRCLNCGHEFLKLSIDGVFRSFHLPNSGRKPEVEIGGQETNNIGGQNEFEPPAGYVQFSGVFGPCVTCGQHGRDSQPLRLSNCAHSYETMCQHCGHKYLIVHLDDSNKPGSVLTYQLEGSGALVEPPAEYKNWPGLKRVITFRRGIICPNCQQYGFGKKELDLPNWDYSMFCTCSNCGHHQLVVGKYGNDNCRYVFHLPPQEKIGGQDISLETQLINSAESIAKDFGSYHALLYLEKLMRADATSEVDPEGVLLDEIINEVYSGESLLNVLLSLMGEAVGVACMEQWGVKERSN